MSEKTVIPMFPLSILPLPGELVPLHIFEPRYQELLRDTEQADVRFGIYFRHAINETKIGSLMKLESVLKRYPGGESDIIVKCIDIFSLDTLYKNYPAKLYPGGDVQLWNVHEQVLRGGKLGELFHDYLIKRHITRNEGYFTRYTIAQELSMDISERYAFLQADAAAQERILVSKIKFQLQLMEREALSRDVYHLN